MSIIVLLYIINTYISCYDTIYDNVSDINVIVSILTVA